MYSNILDRGVSENNNTEDHTTNALIILNFFPTFSIASIVTTLITILYTGTVSEKVNNGTLYNGVSLQHGSIIITYLYFILYYM